MFLEIWGNVKKAIAGHCASVAVTLDHSVAWMLMNASVDPVFMGQRALMSKAGKYIFVLIRPMSLIYSVSRICRFIG